jgi:hypothetical protein
MKSSDNGGDRIAPHIFPILQAGSMGAEKPPPYYGSNDRIGYIHNEPFQQPARLVLRRSFNVSFQNAVTWNFPR